MKKGDGIQNIQKTIGTTLTLLKWCLAGLIVVALVINIRAALLFVTMPTSMTQEGKGREANQNDTWLPGVTWKTTSQNTDANNGTFYITPMVMNNVGLGNKMMVYASVVGLAHSKNMTLVIQATNPLTNIFNLDSKLLRDAEFFKSFKTITSEKCCRYDEMFVKLPRTCNYTINNLLQSWKYFNDVQFSIRHHFTFKDRIKSVAEKRIFGIRQKYESKFSGAITLIGLHVRRGDKSSKKASETGNYVATPEYIERAMTYFISNFSNCVFVVCSDSKQWVKEHVKSVFSMELISENNPAELDLAILSLCEHTIMTVGTFGWWGGFLAGGTVVYYDNPYDEHDKFWNKVFNKTEFYPREWIPML